MHGNVTHGASRSPEHMIWLQIKQRCLNPKNKRFPLYGARGIKMHPEWAESFPAFLRDVGLRPEKGMTLDRKDNSKGYEPGNMRWTTWENQSNNRRGRLMVVLDGVQMTAAQASRKLGLRPKAVAERLRQGVPMSLALTPGQIPHWRNRQRNQAGQFE
jgi:hypothetical protein